MSARSKQPVPSARRVAAPRPDDPRVVRSRAAALEAAQTLFLRKGYAGTTMDEIAALAGLTKRTLYNNYADKEALFTRIVEDVTSYADEFVRGLRQQLGAGIDASSLEESLHELGRRLALAILRPQVIALRRLLIGEANQFPALAKEYYERAPRQVLDMLASGFEHLGRIGVLHVPDARRAAAQFAYLVAGEPLDRAVLVGVLPAKAYVIACARDGVETFLARYGTSRTRSKRTSRRRDASKREQAARRVRRRPGATSG